MAEEQKENKDQKDPLEEEYNKKIVEGFIEPSPVLEDPTVQKPSLKDALSKAPIGNIHALPEEFDLKHVGDLTYLQEIFSSKYDKFHSLDYLKKTRQAMLDAGHADNSMLNEFLFWATMSRKLQIIYQRVHAKLAKAPNIDDSDAENISLLKELRAVSGQVASLQNTLDADLDKRKKVKDVVDLHNETMKAAEEFIQSHIGEFQFKCHKCGSIVDAQGLPHFAIMTDKDNKGEMVYHVFSPELWFLFRKELVPLHFLAFILRTSPEGILLTAEQRKEYGAQVMRADAKTLEEEEGKLKKLLKNYHDGIEAK